MKFYLSELLSLQQKSKIQANFGQNLGIYKFFTCSPVQNKFLDEFNYSEESLIVGTGGKCSVHYCNEPFSTSTDCLVFYSKNNDVLNLKWLYYLLRDNPHILERGFHGSGLKHISRNFILGLKIDLPTLDIQNSIVSILDKINSLIDKVSLLMSKHDLLIKSQFIEMFGDIITNDRHWEVCALSRVAPIQPFSGTIPPSSDNHFWLLNLDMVESNSGEIVSYNMVDKNDIGTSAVMFDETNILYSKLRPYLNKVVIPDTKGYATSELVPLKPNIDKLNRVFLAYLLRSKEFVSYISGKVQGAKMPRVDLKYLKDFNLICPPLNVQNFFSIFVNQIDKSKFRLKELQSKLETLYKSLLQKYFG